jgi:hypothetical protein
MQNSKVSVSLGRTIAIAPYESLRIDITFETQCDREDMDATYAELLEKCDNYIAEVADDAAEAR